MDFKRIASKSSKFVTDNSPLILTVIAATGAVTSAYLTGRAAYKAAEIIAAEESSASVKEPLTTREKFELTWTLYIPSVATMAITTFAIVSANRIGTRRAAAVAAAYSVSERAFEEYRNKVVEKIGEKKEQEVRAEVAQDRVNREKIGNNATIIASNSDDVVCFDSFSGREFASSMEKLRRAENEINYQILHSDYATVTDFYSYVGLESTSISSDMGWNTDKRLHLDISAAMSEDGNRAVMVVEFATIPIRDPWRYQ